MIERVTTAVSNEASRKGQLVGGGVEDLRIPPEPCRSRAQPRLMYGSGSISASRVTAGGYA